MVQKKQAAIIARVSTANQNFDRQLSDLKELAASQGYEVQQENIYAEKISGFKKIDDRLELSRLISDVENGKKIDMIFASEISRISRTPTIGQKFIEDMLKLDIPVYIQNMKRASIDDKTGLRDSMFFIMISILLEFAHTEAEYTKTRIASGRKENYKQGRNQGGVHMVYGYLADRKVDEKKAGKLVINQVEAEVIKNVFDMYINHGIGIKVIANKLNADKVPTRTGTPWSITTVNQLLKNKIYYGTREYIKKRGVNPKNEKKRSLKLDIKETFDNIVPAIITKETYEQALLASTKRNVNKERNITYLYLLAGGKARCGYCGQGYQAKFRPGKHSHYMCGTRYRGDVCAGAGIGIEMIESAAWFFVKNNLGIFSHIKDNNSNLKANQKNIKDLELQLTSYEFDITSKGEERSRWTNLYTKGKVTEDLMDKEQLSIDKSIKVVIHKIESIKTELQIKKDWIVKFNDLNSYFKLVKNIGVDRVKINQILPNVLDKIIITSVTADRLSDEFILSAYLYGTKDIYQSVLFNKRTLTVTPSNEITDKLINYDDNGLATFDINKVVKGFKTFKKTDGGFTVDISKKIERVPFTRLNTSDNFALVPLKTKNKLLV